jgi:glutathione S-transferase
MGLLVAGIDFDAHEVLLPVKPPEMLTRSPKGSVPVMLLPDGTVLEQSWDIMRWALNQDATRNWWEPAQSTDNLDWLARNDGAFKHHLDRYKYPERYNEADRAGHRANALATFLRPLNNRLEQSTFLGGSEPCATDLALFPFVRQFAAVEPDWFELLQLPALQAWLAYWLSSPLFLQCMHKLPGQTTVPFPSLGH